MREKNTDKGFKEREREREREREKGRKHAMNFRKGRKNHNGRPPFLNAANQTVIL